MRTGRPDPELGAGGARAGNRRRRARGPPGAGPAIRVRALDRLDGPDRIAAGAGRARHDVQTVVHAVDKIDVGPAGRPYMPVPRRSAEAGVGSAIVRAEVGLELDDPADPPPVRSSRTRRLPSRARVRPRASAG